MSAIIVNFINFFNNNKKTKSSFFLRSQTAGGGGDNHSLLSIVTLFNMINFSLIFSVIILSTYIFFINN